MSVISQGDDVMELQGITATLNGSPINVFYLYLPPASSCPPQYKPNLDPLLKFSDADAVVLGDFSAHHGVWFTSSACFRGDAVIEAIENSPLCILNSETPTRLPNQGNPNSLIFLSYPLTLLFLLFGALK
jgi:hypothetical protein